LSIDDDFDECIEEENQKIEISKKNVNVREGMWKMFFDGASSCEGVAVGVLFLALGDEYVIPFSYRLQWEVDYTNNVCEYEALVLVLEVARKLKIEHMTVYGDAELIVK
jgi:ribonuclease HI